MARFQLKCTECHQNFPENPDLLLCPGCSRESGHPSLYGVLEIEILDPPSRLPAAPPADSGSLMAFLPISDPSSLAPLAVGGTPLLPVPRLREKMQMSRIWLKDDTRNPSASTKDRASLLVAAKALEYGKKIIATASTGNAATALSAICAASGQQAVVFVPAAAPPAKLIQMQSYGARIIAVDGSYDEAFELCNAACREFGWYNRNTAMNPFTTEGKKTAALEIAAQLSGEMPDFVVVPAGDGVITSGIAKGFAELESWGLISKNPRILIVQPEGSSALIRALEDENEDIRPQPGATSVADSLVVEAPRNSRWALKLIRGSRGIGLSVSEEEILHSIPKLASLTGVFAEPAAATALAGLEKAIRLGILSRENSVVLMVTGSGLKDVAAAGKTLPEIEKIAPGQEGLDRLVRDSIRILG